MRVLGFSAGSGLIVVTLGACIAVAPTGIHQHTLTDPDAGDDARLPIAVDGGTPAEPMSDGGLSDPHAVLGASPSHGSFAGGQRVLIRGRGFSSRARVWFGNVLVDPATTIASDPTRVQVQTVAAKAGTVDISVQNGDDTSTRRTLVGGYTFDAFYASPATGPTSGGIEIALFGESTHWDTTTFVEIDQKPCTNVVIESATRLRCTVPPDEAGVKTIAVTTSGEKTLVLEAFTYEDSDNGYQGGLSGNPLAGQLKVLVVDNYVGAPIPEATVLVGDDVSTALRAKTDQKGIALVRSGALVPPVTVTIGASCHSPVSFTGSSADTVTAYLDPIMSPACGNIGDIPPVGGWGADYGTATGELVWPLDAELKRTDWGNIPSPVSPNEKKVAYVFTPSSDPSVAFQLPPSNTAVPDAPSEKGYTFQKSVAPGNRTLYAIAGLEDDSVSPRRFTGYAMGVVPGVSILPGKSTDSVLISMTKTLDQALTLEVVPPTPGPKGPDRLRADVAVRLGPDGYAILPAGERTPRLPFQGSLSFVGLPGLDSPLSGASYVATVRAVTGTGATAPLSIVGPSYTTTTSVPVAIGGFVPVPVITTPALDAAWDGTHLAVTFPTTTTAVDLLVFDIIAGSGGMHWLITAKGAARTVTVPDLRTLSDLGLPSGPIMISVYAARIDGFDYGKLTYRQTQTRGMTAYSLDVFSSHL